MPNRSPFSFELREEILQRLAFGEKLEDICVEGEGIRFPTVNSVRSWIGHNTTFTDPDSDPENPELEAEGLGFRDRLREKMRAKLYENLPQSLKKVHETKQDMVETTDGMRGNPVAVSRAKLEFESDLKLLERLDTNFAPRSKVSTEDEDGNMRPLVMFPEKVPISGAED